MRDRHSRSAARWIALIVATAMLTSPGCFGSFALTRQLHRWNAQIGEQWTNEFVFLGCIILPVYPISTLGDAIIFNSVEFWSGSNPLMVRADPEDESGQSRVAVLEGFGEGRRIEFRGVETPEGPAVDARVIEGDVVVRRFRVLPEDDGVWYGTTMSGERIASVAPEPDGAYRVRDLRSGTEKVLRP